MRKLQQLKNREILFIVVHYTAGTSSKPGTAKRIADWFTKSDVMASADYIVDDGGFVAYNENPSNFYSFAVGGKLYPKISTRIGGKKYGICKNMNSISVELCSSKKDGTSLKATDRDWFFTEEVLEHGARLVRLLMKNFDIPENRVIMHHQVTGKLCPAMWCQDNASLNGWFDFKARLTSTK